MPVDNESEPGAWEREIERMPWKFQQEQKVGWALSQMRLRGMFKEAEILTQEIVTLKTELESLRKPKIGP
jgi:hypothetical protein